MKKYSGFTLIEMLIVMGIIIILMAAGIAGGRFAIQRANRIQKQSAVENIEQALWGYYSDYRKYPSDPSGVTPKELIEDYLSEYIDAGQFDGGADGTFYYFVTGVGQEFVVCASLGGFRDERGLGVYCSGNGLDTIEPFSSHDLPSDNVYEDGPVYTGLTGTLGDQSNWYGECRDWDSCP